MAAPVLWCEMRMAWCCRVNRRPCIVTCPIAQCLRIPRSTMLAVDRGDASVSRGQATALPPLPPARSVGKNGGLHFDRAIGVTSGQPPIAPHRSRITDMHCASSPASRVESFRSASLLPFRDWFRQILLLEGQRLPRWRPWAKRRTVDKPRQRPHTERHKGSRRVKNPPTI